MAVSALIQAVAAAWQVSTEAGGCGSAGAPEGRRDWPYANWGMCCSARTPIRPELRPLYPPHLPELSRRVRFERAGGQCQRCGRL
jgi:hypothetical protein